MRNIDKKELFETAPVPKALAAMAVPTIISQIINLVYNMAHAFFIGRTGNSYMMAATTITLTLTMLNVAFSNLFGVGGGSLTARLMGAGKKEKAESVSAFSALGCCVLALVYSSLIAVFLKPVLFFLGASDATIGFAEQYTMLVIVFGSLPAILSLTLAHLLRNAGYSSQASIGLSSGGIINIALDPLFMFVLFPKGSEVAGAAAATLISNILACSYLLFVYIRISKAAPLSLSPIKAAGTDKENIKSLFYVGVPSAILTGLFDLANICVNIIASAHNDLVLAAMGIVMKVERIPNAVNIGICQGMIPIVAYNYSSGNRERMKQTVNTARMYGLAVSAVSIILLELFATPVTGLFLDTSDSETAAVTLKYASLFLMIRATASPVQLINYHTSFCMQAMGKGKETMLHAVVREIVFYIPLMFALDRLFGETGLAAALPVGELCGAIFALLLIRHVLKKQT